MNVGLIAKRYASALEQYSTELGQADACVADAGRMLHLADSLTGYLKQPMPVAAKMAILEKALPDASDAFSRFLTVVVEHRREMYLKRILQSYIALYKKARGILDARLTVASPPSEQLLSRLEQITLEKVDAKKVDIEVTVNPDIIGGFVYKVEDRRLDASVRRQINDLKRAFEVKNKRII